MNRIVRDGTFSSIGLASFSTENAIPVENAANAPHAIPNPGMNIGSASVVLCENIPIASISPIPVHGDVASRVSTTRETVARVMNDLARQGVVERLKDALLVNDVEKLREMVEEVRGE